MRPATDGRMYHERTGEPDTPQRACDDRRDGALRPFVGRAWASTTEINMLAWYGHGEADIVGAFEEANNVKFKPKYYAGGDNMLALIAQSPPGTYDVILSDAEFVQQLNAAGYIEPLNANDYPFDDMLHEDFTKFRGHWDGDTLFSMMVRFGIWASATIRPRSRPKKP